MTDKIEELIERLEVHSLGLCVNARYDPEKPSGLTNADAASYGKLLTVAAAALRTQRNEVVEECAQTGYRVCAETRHVTLGDKVATAIRNLKREDEPR